MTNYVTMRNRIADEMINSALTTSHINNAIQSAIKYYERSEFYFNQAIGTFNTVANQEYYGSADFADIPYIVEIKSLTADLNGISNKLNSVDFQLMDETQTNFVIGFPFSYAYYRQQIRMYPIPNAVYPVTLSYVKRFSTLVNDADTNAWMTDGEELIRNGAKLRLNVDVLQDDAGAARCSARAQDLLEALQEETSKRIPAQQLRTEVITPKKTFNIIRGY